MVDHYQADVARPMRSLSGGERFLASLALALGLGDVAAESSGRLDCLFLDETGLRDGYCLGAKAAFCEEVP